MWKVIQLKFLECIYSVWWYGQKDHDEWQFPWPSDCTRYSVSPGRPIFMMEVFCSSGKRAYWDLPICLLGCFLPWVLSEVVILLVKVPNNFAVQTKKRFDCVKKNWSCAVWDSCVPNSTNIKFWILVQAGLASSMAFLMLFPEQKVMCTMHILREFTNNDAFICYLWLNRSYLHSSLVMFKRLFY